MRHCRFSRAHRAGPQELIDQDFGVCSILPVVVASLRAVKVTEEKTWSRDSVRQGHFAKSFGRNSAAGRSLLLRLVDTLVDTHTSPTLPDCLSLSLSHTQRWRGTHA